MDLLAAALRTKKKVSVLKILVVWYFIDILLILGSVRHIYQQRWCPLSVWCVVVIVVLVIVAAAVVALVVEAAAAAVVVCVCVLRRRCHPRVVALDTTASVHMFAYNN